MLRGVRIISCRQPEWKSAHGRNWLGRACDQALFPRVSAFLCGTVRNRHPV